MTDHTNPSQQDKRKPRTEIRYTDSDKRKAIEFAIGCSSRGRITQTHRHLQGDYPSLSYLTVRAWIQGAKHESTGEPMFDEEGRYIPLRSELVTGFTLNQYPVTEDMIAAYADYHDLAIVPTSDTDPMGLDWQGDKVRVMDERRAPIALQDAHEQRAIVVSRARDTGDIATITSVSSRGRREAAGLTRRVGVSSADKNELLQRLHATAHEALDRVSDGMDEVSAAQAAVIAGISLDHMAKLQAIEPKLERLCVAMIDACRRAGVEPEEILQAMIIRFEEQAAAMARASSIRPPRTPKGVQESKPL